MGMHLAVGGDCKGAPLRSSFLDMRNPTALFWVFVSLHGIVWTLVPTLSQPNGHRDVIELLNWARHPQWGYWKHPPLQAWVMELFVRMAGGGLWGIYLASQLVISACFWAVWRFAHDYLEPPYALLSVFLLEGILYYNYNSPKFIHDTLQLPLWALTVLFLWLALKSGRVRYWLMCGVAIGLGLLSKYSIVFLLAPLSIFMLMNADARRHFATPGPYITAATAALIVAPHAIWLFENDFTTVTYGLGRAAGQGQFTDHVVNPLIFAFNQALTLVPVMIMVGLLMFRSTPNRQEVASASFPRAFLLTAALGPFVAYLLTSAITGFQVRSGWGTPLWSFLGVFILYHLRPALTDKAVRRFSYAFLSFAAIWVVVFVGHFALGPTLTGKVKPEHFPGKSIAAYVTAQSAKHYGTRLPVVGGDQWLSENVGFYSPDRPDVYADLDQKKNPWVNDEAFRQRGGILIWDAETDGSALPDRWRQRFPGALVQPTVGFGWQTSANVPEVKIGWAFVGPAP